MPRSSSFSSRSLVLAAAFHRIALGIGLPLSPNFWWRGGWCRWTVALVSTSAATAIVVAAAPAASDATLGGSCRRWSARRGGGGPVSGRVTVGETPTHMDKINGQNWGGSSGPAAAIGAPAMSAALPRLLATLCLPSAPILACLRRWKGGSGAGDGNSHVQLKQTQLLLAQRASILDVI
jgi:hypothetical protein